MTPTKKTAELDSTYYHVFERGMDYEETKSQLTDLS